MIVHNFPSLGRQALKDQREYAVGLFAVRRFGKGQLKFAGYYGRPPAQQINVEILKFKFAHFLAFRLVALAIALQGRFPSPGD